MLKRSVTRYSGISRGPRAIKRVANVASKCLFSGATIHRESGSSGTVFDLWNAIEVTRQETIESEKRFKSNYGAENALNRLREMDARFSNHFPKLS